MKYFIDTEFIEGKQIKRLFGLPLNTIIPNGYNKPTIDLISIGIVAEDERKYSAISKEFNLKEAWNRYDLKDDNSVGARIGATSPKRKVYWIRENVLRPIFEELILKELNIDQLAELEYPFTYRGLKYLINKYGKTNKQIAEEIKHFVANRPINSNKEQWILDYDTKDVQFYGYYCDYDWVVFCWLFGKMIDLPKGFPMYCIDLKPILDNKVNKLETYQLSNIVFPNGDKGFTNDKDGILSVKLDRIKECSNYPKQTNEHNALSDAKWTKELYNFLNTL